MMINEIINVFSAFIEGVAVSVSELLVFLFPFLPADLPEKPAVVMLVVGFGGQFLFASRFIIQWLVSERGQRSVIPMAFWYFSIAGGAVLLLYAIWRKDPVIICGQSLGLFIYLRNLTLIHRERGNRTQDQRKKGKRQKSQRQKSQRQKSKRER